MFARPSVLGHDIKKLRGWCARSFSERLGLGGLGLPLVQSTECGDGRYVPPFWDFNSQSRFGKLPEQMVQKITPRLSKIYPRTLVVLGIVAFGVLLLQVCGAGGFGALGQCDPSPCHVEQ